MVHLLKGRPQIVHINMFSHNCICIKLFMPPEGATQKSYKALQIMSLFRLKTVVKTPMIPYLVCRPKVIFFFFFFPLPPQLKVLLWKSLVGNAWESLRESALAVLTFWLLFSTFTSVMWWLVGIECVLPVLHCESWKYFGYWKSEKTANAQCWKDAQPLVTALTFLESVKNAPLPFQTVKMLSSLGVNAFDVLVEWSNCPLERIA